MSQRYTPEKRALENKNAISRAQNACVFCRFVWLTHMFRTIHFIEFFNSVKYNCFYMTFATSRCRQIHLFGRIYVLLGLAPRLWRVKVVRRHRGSCASHRSRAGAVARPSSFDGKHRCFGTLIFFALLQICVLLVPHCYSDAQVVLFRGWGIQYFQNASNMLADIKAAR